MNRVRLTDFEDSSWAAEQYLTMYSDASGRTGLFLSRHGFVRVYLSSGRRASTFLIFIHDGRQFTRKWEKLWGDKTVARLAREFADDVIAGRA